MQSDRIDKLKEDVKDFFPYAGALHYAKTGVYATLYLSRVPFPAGTFSDTASDKRRIVRLQAHGIKVAEAPIPKEGDIVVILAKLSHGVGEFSEG